MNKEQFSFYITTTLPYVNDKPHIGFAMEILIADVMARHHRFSGKEVFFNTGTDEHGLKIFQKARELDMEVKKYCDQNAEKFFGMKSLLNLSFDNFIRTTEERHIYAAQEFWKKCEKNGDIYKKSYAGKYCVGCESEKTDSELVNGECPLHPGKKIEIIAEENYFFRFSKYQRQLLDFYKKNPRFILPEKRFNELKRFVEGGLDDFSISRLKEKMPWGIPVPGDENQVMYVWFDALVNYVAAVGWPDDFEKFDFWWPAVQICGKDNLRFQGAMWQAMLFSAGLYASKQVFINGFITIDGQKMSKTLGNVISPEELVEKFGVDGTRYLLLSFGNFGEDIDFNLEKLTEKYNADLANGLGNLVSRILKMTQGLNFPMETAKNSLNKEKKLEIHTLIEKGEIGRGLEKIWEIARSADKKIETQKPWELAKNDRQKFIDIMTELLSELNSIADFLAPFLPETSTKIKDGLRAKEISPLFLRIK